MVSYDDLKVSTWNSDLKIRLNTLAGIYSFIVFDFDKEFTLKNMKDTDLNRFCTTTCLFIPEKNQMIINPYLNNVNFVEIFGYIRSPSF